MRHVGAVKIAAHGDDVRAAEGQKVLCVREQVLNVRLYRIIVQECFEIVETHKAAAVADDAELVVREVSRVLAEHLGVRVRRDERAFGVFGHIIKECFGSVRNVNNDALFFHFLHGASLPNGVRPNLSPDMTPLPISLLPFHVSVITRTPFSRRW